MDFGSNHSYFEFRDYLTRISGEHPPFSNVGFASFFVICTGESDTTEGDNEKVKALCFLFLCFFHDISMFWPKKRKRSHRDCLSEI